MVSCAVARCKNSSAKSKKCRDGITFHRIASQEHEKMSYHCGFYNDVTFTGSLQASDLKPLLSDQQPGLKRDAELSSFRKTNLWYRFPQDEQRRKKWEIAVNREAEWRSTESSAVCSEHFEAKDFYYTESGLRRLLTDATPIINISACEDNEPTIANIEPIDVKPTDTEEVIQLKHKVRRLEVIAANRKKQISLMTLERKRMQKKLAEMKRVVQHLVQHEAKRNGSGRGNT